MRTKAKAPPFRRPATLILVEYCPGHEEQAEAKAAEIKQKTGNETVTVPMGDINVRLGWAV